MYLTFYQFKKFSIDPITFKKIYKEPYNETFTVHLTKINKTQRTQAQEKERILNTFWGNLPKEIKNLVDTDLTMETHYYNFKIPKKSSGFRQINAPNDTLKTIQTEISQLFTKKLQVIPHNSAFAYITNRSSVDALVKHQKNKSHWFLKLDITDFFPSCTEEVVYNKLRKLFPFALFSTIGQKNLKKLIHLCCLNGALPQGSPTSPCITNLLFTDFDYKIVNYLKEKGQFVYTRYADDMLISSKKEFNWLEIQNDINDILGKHFNIKKEKTRYGSGAGSNWNLGLMLNKDNNITIGYRKNQNLKAQICNFIAAYKSGQLYTIPETQHLLGNITYARKIEPDYINYIIKHYSKKFNCDVEEAIKYCLKKH